MTASDGYVGATTKIVDHGPASSRWNLVVLGDGYQVGELAQYQTDVESFVSGLRSTPPYDSLWCGINVYRIDVVSNESGADDPADCPDGTGSGAAPHTYFDATFCSVGPGTVRLSRLLTVDSARAKSVALARVPEMHQAIVIVNSPKYGGSGGQIAVCSTNGLAAKIAIHEIGHSAFKLADEYEGDGTGTTPGESPKPNVTRDTNRATNKWRDLVLASTPMPSSCYTECGDCTSPATPVPANAVGTYEGADYSHCGVYRPFPHCYMRDYSPFCPVCARVIVQTLQPFLPPESITLTTPSLSFTNIPEGIGSTGVTTYRAIVFDVVTCRPLTFHMTAPPAGFSAPFGLSASADNPTGITPLGHARLWIGYTSTTAGSSLIGSVTVQCDQTGQSWTVTLAANTVLRPKSEVVLVLDHSGSMAEDAGDGTTKVLKVREAAGIFVDAMLSGDALGLVRFNDTVQRLMDSTDVGPLATGAGRATAVTHINSPELDPAGATSIGGGVAEGKHALDDGQAAASPPYDVQAMVVLTDGKENTAPMLADVSSSISANTFAIGLGLPSNISVAALDALTQGHHGYLLVTGSITTGQRTRLTKYFLQVLAGITNANIVVDPGGEVPIGGQHRIPFDITEADYGLDAYLLTPYPTLFDYALETPDGSLIGAGTYASLGTTEAVQRPGMALYRVALPAIPANQQGSHSGRWHAILRAGKRSPWDQDAVSRMARARRLLPYDIVVHAYSNLLFEAGNTQNSYEPGAEVRLSARLTEYAVPLSSGAGVWAEVERPDGVSMTVALSPESEGTFTGVFTADLPGLYTIRARAQGETSAGSLFTREKALSAVAIVGGDRPATGGEQAWCDLVRCLAENRHLRDQLGGGLGEVINCLAKHCDRRTQL